MYKTDLAITSCSSILWECLVLNTAGIGIKTVDNQNLLFNMLKDKNWASNISGVSYENIVTLSNLMSKTQKVFFKTIYLFFCR